MMRRGLMTRVLLWSLLGLGPGAGKARAAEGLMPDEVGIQGVKIVDDLGELGGTWNGIGGRLGWRLAGPLVLEGDLWSASAAGRGGAGGAMVSGKLLLEGLVTGVYGRAGLARYRGGAATGFGGGLEVYVVKKLVIRGEAELLFPRDNKDLALSLGLAFRL